MRIANSKWLWFISIRFEFEIIMLFNESRSHTPLFNLNLQLPNHDRPTSAGQSWLRSQYFGNKIDNFSVKWGAHANQNGNHQGKGGLHVQIFNPWFNLVARWLERTFRWAFAPGPEPVPIAPQFKCYRRNCIFPDVLTANCNINNCEIQLNNFEGSLLNAIYSWTFLYYNVFVILFWLPGNDKYLIFRINLKTEQKGSHWKLRGVWHNDLVFKKNN